MSFSLLTAMGELLLGLIVVFFGMLLIVYVSNKIISYTGLLLHTNDTIILLLHLYLIIAMIIGLRYIVSKIIKNKAIVSSLFYILGPIIGAGSLYMSNYVKKITTM